MYRKQMERRVQPSTVCVCVCVSGVSASLPDRRLQSAEWAVV